MADFLSVFRERSGPERIAKRLARAGLCSRRDAERWIAAGRVSVDGRVLDSPALAVDGASRILVDGRPIPEIGTPRLWRHHKPRGRIVSNRDARGRPTVFDGLPADMPRVVAVGRLDLDSEGLLLLANDGELARLLELPSTGWVRRYRVRVRGRPEPDRLAALKRGLELDGERFGPIEAELDRQGPGNAWLTVALREGRNREVRRALEHVGLAVNRLIRVSFGPFQLGSLPAGETAEVRPGALREQLGAARPGGGGTARAKPAAGRPGKPPGARAGAKPKSKPRGADRRR